MFTSQFVNATTLVAFRDSKSVVLAADSKVVNFKTYAPLATQSKISRCGKYFVAISGIQFMIAPDVRFNLTDIIASSCKQQQTPVQALHALAKRLETDYAKMIAALSLVEPSYTRVIASSEVKVIAENLILVGTDKGIPFIFTYSVMPYLENDNILVHSSILSRNYRLKRNALEYAYGGTFTDLRVLLDNEIKKVPTNNLVQAAPFLVDYQISKTPETSGYPIDVVEITAAGKVRWLFCNPNCKANNSR